MVKKKKIYGILSVLALSLIFSCCGTGTNDASESGEKSYTENSSAENPVTTEYIDDVKSPDYP